MKQKTKAIIGKFEEDVGICEIEGSSSMLALKDMLKFADERRKHGGKTFQRGKKVTGERYMN